MRRRHISVLAPISALVAVSMGLSACGGGSNEATPSPSLSAVTTARPSAAVTTVRPSPTGPAATASPAAGSTTGSFTVQASNNATLGKTILVDAQGITLYRYDKDSAEQVTYNGMPLYTFQQDAKPGDATGDGVNSFHVVTP